MMSTYFWVNLLSIAIPFLGSFESRVQYYKKWKYLFPSLFISAFVFIAWDAFFTKWGVWGFNPLHLSGWSLLHLPVEEWLFFFCIPYSCLYIYEWIRFAGVQLSQKTAKRIALVMILTFLSLGIIHIEKAYTAVTFISTSIFLIGHLTLFKSSYLGRFFVAYAIVLIPFFIVNGVLTGTGIEQEVVWYNDQENLGIRMGTIPVEDSVYGMLLILLNVTLLEWFKSKF